MNGMQSDDTGSYLNRQLAPALADALADTPVVCLLGPRQCGKSTLARRQAPNRAYLSLDDRNYLDFARNDPQGFVDALPEQVTIDEIQRVPELTLAMKRSVDANRRPGRFLVTGSANLLQVPRLADSLAGRRECLYLQPFTESEKVGSSRNFLKDWMQGRFDTRLIAPEKPAPSTLPARLVEGGYPEAFGRPPKRARNWQRQYIKSIIERDIREVAEVKDGNDIARLIAFVSHQTGQLLNVSAMANALGHTRETVERHLGILEKLFLIRRLPAWHSNRGKRLVKAPKIHVCDSGLATALSDLSAEQWLDERPRFGHVLESFVVQQLAALASWMDSDVRLWHYRDKDQVEVDAVIERGSEVWGVEVKLASTCSPSDGKGLRRLAALSGKRFQGGIVFYGGFSVVPLDPDLPLHAVPVSKLWEPEAHQTSPQ